MTQVAPLEQACQQQAAVNSATDAEAAGQERAGTPGSGTSNGSFVPVEIQQALLPKVVLQHYQHPFGPWRRRYMVGLVSLIAALLCADQNLLAPNLSAAAAYFGLNDQQKDTILGGYLMAAFFLIGAPSALLCGYLADTHNRVLMLAAIIIIGEAPCLCTYWVTELWQFFVLRMLTGIAVGGCFPLVFSLMGDLFPTSQRSAMAALVQIAVGFGIGGGQLLAGMVGPATNWKVPFVILAAPSLLLAVLLLLTVREPPRGAYEEALRGQLAAGAAYSESISWRKVKQLLAIPSNWIIILQGLPGCLPWGVMQTYINDYLHLNKGFSVEMATVVILMFGLGGGVGVLAGGAAGQLLYNWRKEAMAVLTGVSVLAGVGPVYFLVNADLMAAGYASALLMSALAGFLVSMAGPNLRAIMINVNTPETRGVSLALQSVTDDLGRGLGPVIVAGFISAMGRQGAFNLSVAGWVPCGLMLCCLVFTMRKDEQQMQQRLGKSADAALQQIQVMQGDAGTGGGEVVGEPVSVHAGSSSSSSSGSSSVGGDWLEHGSSSSSRGGVVGLLKGAGQLSDAPASVQQQQQQHGLHSWVGDSSSSIHHVQSAAMASPLPAVERVQASAAAAAAAARQRPGSDTGQPASSFAAGLGPEQQHLVKLKSRMSDPGVAAAAVTSSGGIRSWFAGRGVANSAGVGAGAGPGAAAAAAGSPLHGRLPEPERNSSWQQLLEGGVSSSRDGRGETCVGAAASWVSRSGIHLRGKTGGSGGSSSGEGGPLGEAREGCAVLKSEHGLQQMSGADVDCVAAYEDCTAPLHASSGVQC
uniref:Major facilitator superfamily (MFS) profile domain-containing protein n=1 Tax=Tetradesmus obliquus TaxID=3088 RepID=A0A383W382_TETOB|eukprot:jgi/Sobl393_1/10013/SZX71572.1